MVELHLNLVRFNQQMKELELAVLGIPSELSLPNKDK